jgi:Calcineurin-like phosphoesterase
MAPGRFVPLTCALTTALVTTAAAQNPSVTYVVLGKKGAVARAVIPVADGAAVPGCPDIVVDGTPRAMKLRAAPDADFNIVVCEFSLPSATSATIAGQALPLPPDTLKSIAVFGDTGCRLKAGKDEDEMDEMDEPEEAAAKAGGGKYQDCKTDWPFQPMSETIAKAKPDLVIHVGDYYYRESPCDDHPGCTNSPYGDKWSTWAADFFTPAAALLKASPWIVARGNHEICSRGGLGYARLLDPTPVDADNPPKCDPSDPPLDQYTVKVGGRSFVMLDSSAAPDECPQGGCDSDWYRGQFGAMNPAPGTWLITHKPIWGFTYSKDKHTGERKLGIRNMMLQTALNNKTWKNVPPAGIELVVSGHIHLWEALSFSDGRTPQFVLGAGGTKLAHKLPKKIKGHKIGGTTVAAIASDHEFGYTLFEPSKKGRHWSATFYDPSGSPRLTCKVEPTKATCE